MRLAGTSLAIDQHARRVAVEDVSHRRAATRFINVLLLRIRVEDALEVERAQPAARRHREHLRLVAADVDDRRLGVVRCRHLGLVAGGTFLIRALLRQILLTICCSIWRDTCCLRLGRLGLGLPEALCIQAMALLLRSASSPCRSDGLQPPHLCRCPCLLSAASCSGSFFGASFHEHGHHVLLGRTEDLDVIVEQPAPIQERHRPIRRVGAAKLDEGLVGGSRGRRGRAAVGGTIWRDGMHAPLAAKHTAALRAG
mmetsp:Transcript_64315/g.176508  ORF Transcript_64315/g.176508 Transcript_64315/m.176508 type:complete len:255 (+) Transcript_64315:1746-2510(+)